LRTCRLALGLHEPPPEALAIGDDDFWVDLKPRWWAKASLACYWRPWVQALYCCCCCSCRPDDSQGQRPQPAGCSSPWIASNLP